MNSAYRLGLCRSVAIAGWVEDHYATAYVWELIVSHPESGRRFRYCGPVAIDGRETGEDLIRRIEAWAERNKFDPEGRACWEEIAPRYGSPAWGPGAEAELDRFDRDAEEFPVRYAI